VLRTSFKSPFRFLNLYLFCAVFVIFPTSITRAQTNLDTLFSLNAPDRFFTISTLFVQLKTNPTQLKKLYEVVQAKGSVADKYLVNTNKAYEKIDPAGVSKLKFIEQAEKDLVGAGKLGEPFVLAKFYYDVSVRSGEAGLFNKSFEYNLYCLDELSKDPEGRYYQQAYILYQFANEYYLFKDYPAAIRLSKAACITGTRYTPNAVWFIKVAPNLTGMAYLKNGDFDSANAWLQKTLNVAAAQKDTAWMGIATGNLGNVKYNQNRFADAIPLYQQGLVWCRQSSLWDNVVAFCSNLADCYIKQGDYSTAEKLIAEGKEANKKAAALFAYLSNQIKLYTVAQAYSRSIGNESLALQYADSVKKYEIKEQEEFDRNEKIKTEALLAYRNKELENQVLKQEKKKDRMMLYGLGIALFLLLLIGVLYTKRQRLRHQLKKEKLEKEKLLAEEELNMALTEIKGFTFHIIEKNKLLEAYTTEIDKLRAEHHSITNQQMESLERLKELTVLTDEEWNQFKTLFGKIHPGYLQSLNDKYPDLTPAEIRFMVFTKLNITPKEMTAMLGVSTETIRGIRFRLKKKLNLQDGNEIEKVVKEI
jgi:hypothetical protein